MKEILFVQRFLCILSKVCGKVKVCLDCQEKNSISNLSIKKKPRNKYITLIYKSISWVFFMLCLIYFKKSTRKVLSTFTFYTWWHWSTEVLMKLLVSERDAFWWAYLSIVSKLFGKRLSILLGKNTRFQFHLLKT